MADKSDVERLIRAHAEVKKVLETEPTNPFRRVVRRAIKPPERQAARILCDELGWLVNERESYWRGLQEASERLAQHRASEAALLGNIARVIDLEVAVFNRLGLSEEASSSVIAETYDAISIARDYQDPSPESLRNLRNRLAQARELICAAARNPLQRAYDKVIGSKGGRILAGGAVGGANVAIAIMADSGALSWVSLKAGYHVMRGDTEGLIDLLEGGAG